ncbi:flavin-containing monooxygenase [Novosphingobium bradum]|uniref:Flavin-containing monooxygenase n=1 Tax=Novosphingobium bradum TaxID=1737444 RepID=A0ABV7IJ66_9SPHN
MTASQPVHRTDVIIVGAGISGIGAAVQLGQQCPGKSFVVLEALESFGGTWLVHKYPGIRSDSDLYTFGYRYKPWTGQPIATRAEILRYLGETIDEFGVADRFRYGRKVLSAAWSSAENAWTLTVANTAEGTTETYVANFLWSCQGYYRHERGHTPEWPGFDSFAGEVIHPQTWPEDADLAGKRVVCIGSGATAATLIPSIADTCAHITLLQRSPTFFTIGRNTDERARELFAQGLSEMEVFHQLRAERLEGARVLAERSFNDVENLRRDLIDGVRKYLPEDLVEAHFQPRYKPWQQRIAFIPDADMMEAFAQGRASVVTDQIDHFTPDGIQLQSGQFLPADVVITATGFDMAVMPGVPFTVDGAPVDWSQTISYRGTMFAGVPNLAWVMGYFRGSWTLRVDLLCDFICRLLQRMDRLGAARVDVRPTPEDDALPRKDWMDLDVFNPGYLQRALPHLPRRLDTPRWRHTQDYQADLVDLPAVTFEEPEFIYTAAASGAAPGGHPGGKASAAAPAEA